MEPYLGVDADHTYELGRLVVAAGRVEGTFNDIADALMVPPDTGSPTTVAKRIRKRLDEAGVPPWARTTPTEILSWMDQAATALDGRAEVIHASLTKRRREDDYVDVAVATWRRPNQTERTAADVTAKVEELHAAFMTGNDLHNRLLCEVEPGVYHTMYPPDEPHRVVVDFDAHGGWPDSREGVLEAYERHADDHHPVGTELAKGDNPSRSSIEPHLWSGVRFGRRPWARGRHAAPRAGDGVRPVPRDGRLGPKEPLLGFWGKAR